MLSIRSEREKLVVTSNQNFTRRSNGLSPECTTYYAIDEHSRISFAAILPDQSHRSAIRFFLMARAHFNRFGIIICRVYSDNGSCYRHWLYRKLMNELHLKQRFTRSYTSRTNGNAERFIQTALREWAYARSYQNSNGREEQIKYWLHDYNFHCPHASLKLQTPASRAALNRNNLLSLHSVCLHAHSGDIFDSGDIFCIGCLCFQLDSIGHYPTHIQGFCLDFYIFPGSIGAYFTFRCRRSRK